MSKILDCAIIGSGPAGFTSAIYLLRNNLDIVLLEKNIPGGAIVNTASIENYPGFETIGGADLASKMYTQVLKLGAHPEGDEIKSIKKGPNGMFTLVGDNNIYYAKYVILALGLENRKLGFTGEEKFIGRGITFCAVCDGFLYKDQEVAVAGGGSAALEESLYLASICKKVYIIHRREVFRADDSIVEKVKKNPKIELVLNETISEVVGEEKFEGLKLNSGKIIKVKALFEFVGYIPHTKFLEPLDILDDKGFVVVDKHYETKIEGMFAVGDVIETEVRQIATAIGDGAYAST
ncbi:MAG: FAD-dependent oxidoreductase, partial [Bacilli bacterium]